MTCDDDDDDARDNRIAVAMYWEDLGANTCGHTHSMRVFAYVIVAQDVNAHTLAANAWFACGREYYNASPAGKHDCASAHTHST